MKLSLSGNASLRNVIRRAHLRMAAVAIALAGALLLIVGVATLRLYLSNNLHLVARSLAYTVEASLVFGDRDEAARVLDQLLRGEGVAHAEVFDAEGRPFVRWSGHGGSALSSIGELLAVGIGLPRAEADVRQDGRLVGSVQLASDGVGLVRFLGAGFIVLVLCVGVSGYVGLRQSRRMLRDIAEPLQQLARVARAVRHDRSMDQRVPLARIAELRELGDNFNALLAELQTRHERLQQQNSAWSDRLRATASPGWPTGCISSSDCSRRWTVRRRAGRSWPCCFWTTTASSRSTTPTAMPWAMCCSRRWVPGCARRCARPIWSPAWVATNSPSCSIPSAAAATRRWCRTR